MPVVFKELKVKAVVEPGNRQNGTLSSKDIERIRKAVVRECLEQLKTYLKEQKER